MSKTNYGIRATGHPSLKIRPETRKDLVAPTTVCLVCGQPFSNTTKHPAGNGE